jgi:hypothetical protein
VETLKPIVETLDVEKPDRLYCDVGQAFSNSRDLPSPLQVMLYLRFGRQFVFASGDG